MRTDVRIPRVRWGLCSDCHKERRCKNGVMVEHRRYDARIEEMVYCHGSGYAPDFATAYHERKKNELEKNTAASR